MLLIPEIRRLSSTDLRTGALLPRSPEDVAVDDCDLEPCSKCAPGVYHPTSSRVYRCIHKQNGDICWPKLRLPCDSCRTSNKIRSSSNIWHNMVPFNQSTNMHPRRVGPRATLLRRPHFGRQFVPPNIPELHRLPSRRPHLLSR
jgi:hypothetical protein